MLLFLATFVGIILMFPLIDFEIDNWEDKVSNKYGQLCCDQDFLFFSFHYVGRPVEEK
jgi:hypothetical protein